MQEAMVLEEQEGPFVLGVALGELMDRYAVTGHWIARQPDGVPNVVTYGILRGLRPVVTWETVHRLADAIEVTPAERIVLMNAWETDIALYQAASQCVYRLYETADPAVSGPILDLLATRMAPHFAKLKKPIGSYRTQPPPPGQRRGGVKRGAIPFGESVGFERVRQLAELPAGHRLRWQLLHRVLLRTDLNWSAGEAAFVPGPLLTSGASLLTDWQNPSNSTLVRASWHQSRPA